MRLAAYVPSLYNRAVTSPILSSWIKQFSGFAPGRSLPKLYPATLAAWHARHANPSSHNYPNGRVYLFCDEFTNYNDTHIRIAAIELLNGLGYEIVNPAHVESGRAQLSKGLVRAREASSAQC